MVRNQDKLKWHLLHTHPPSQAQLHSFFSNSPSSSPHPKHCTRMGNGGLRSVHNSCTLQFTPSHASVSIGPFSKLWSIRINLLLYGLHRPQFLQGVSPIFGMVLSIDCREYLLHRNPLHGVQGHLCSSTWNSFSLPSLMLVSSGLSRHHWLCTWAWLCHVVDLLQNFTEDTPVHPPAASTLPQVWTWISKHQSCFVSLQNKAELAVDHQTKIGRIQYKIKRQEKNYTDRKSKLVFGENYYTVAYLVTFLLHYPTALLSSILTLCK